MLILDQLKTIRDINRPGFLEATWLSQVSST